MKKATSTDVAKLAGVSQTTVSLVMTGNKSISISDETREKVLSAANALGYKPKKKAISVPPARIRTIGILIPTLSNPYYTTLIQMIEHYAASKGYKVLLGNTFRDKSSEQFYLDLFSNNLVSGIIYTFLPSYPILANKLSESIPVVLIGEKQDNIQIPSIGLSNIKSGLLIGRHLTGMGHKKLAFVTTPLDNVTMSRKQRLEGLRAAMLEASLQADDVYVISHSYPETDTLFNNVEYELGLWAAEEILTNYPDVTAIVGVNDMTALGVCQGLLRNNKRIPQDFSVCGFDNILLSAMSNPSLTTIDHHLDQRASVAVNMIADFNQSKEPLSFQLMSVSKIEYEPQLIYRQSSGKVL